MVGKASTSAAVDVLQTQAAAAAGFRAVAHDQVGIDDQAGTYAVAGGPQGCRVEAIRVGRSTAGWIDVRGTHDQQATAIGRDGGVEALVEEDAVVLDVAVVAQAHVTDTASVAAAQVAADPVVVELVVVGAGADADTARPRRRAGEQFVTGGRVQRDVVVVDVDAQVHCNTGWTAPLAIPVATQEPGGELVVLP